MSDEEWAFVAPYLALCREDAKQREHSLRAVFNALRMQGPTRSLAHDIAGSAAAADSVPADEALNPGSVVRNHGSRICARRYVSSLDATLNPRR